MQWSDKLMGRVVAALTMAIALGEVGIFPACAQAQHPPVLTVGKGVGAQYASIQAAIDAAPEKGVVRIEPGVYEGTLTIRKPVTLEGRGWDRTILVAAIASAEQVQQAIREAEQQAANATSEAERRALIATLRDRFLRPAIRIENARGVELRGLKVIVQPPALSPARIPQCLVVISQSQVRISGCAFLGSPGDGLQITDGSEAEIGKSLVAGLWGTGIVVGEREGAKVRATIADCDIRNCHYAGIRVRAGHEATVERCRISGAAWHGIRYDDASPIITGNRIFANARCGIYASGQTAATVKGNVFYKNEMTGISCWFANRDTITENTFVGNVGSGLSVLGASAPTVTRNIFQNTGTAIECGPINEPGPAAAATGNPKLQGNLFWKNAAVYKRTQLIEGKASQEDVKLAEQTESAELDPLLVKPETDDYALAADSPARRTLAGAVQPLAAASPWLLQPEEQAIIPDGPTRDSRQWKQGTSNARPSGRTPVTQPALPAGPPPALALLFHNDAEVRIRTVEAIAATRDPQWIDDLIRANAVEFYTPVLRTYAQALAMLTGDRTPRNPGQWKAWLLERTAAGQLKADYHPLDLDKLNPDQQSKLQPLADRLGPEHFDRMAQALDAKAAPEPLAESLRYMVFNDHRPEVQKLLGGDWLSRFLTERELRPVEINMLAFQLNGLADPGPIRERINAQVRQCLDSSSPVAQANALHLLAGVEGYTTVFTVPDVAEKVGKLVDSPAPQVAAQARRALVRVDPKALARVVSYQEAFTDLYEVLGREYPCFQLKGIDWKAVGQELLPRAGEVKSEAEFGLLCQELVARLEDSHAFVGKAAADPPVPPFARWDPGLSCLIDDRGRPVVYHVDRRGPADQAGIRPGMAVVAINGNPADEMLAEQMKRLSRYSGHSSDRYLRYHAAQFLLRQMEQNAIVRVELEDVDGAKHRHELLATLGVRYLPRLPVPIPGIQDSGSISWKMFDDQIGYIYVRRIGNDLIDRLDRAVGELKNAKGLIIDVRGNSGGGFDGRRSHRNFAPADPQEPDRPRFAGPVAVLIDARCISAGEGWASWFIANKRARFFGETTAGASSSKRTYPLKNGLYTVTFSIRAYTGYLDRPIERRGLEPDVPVRQNARDLAAGRDTVLEAAKQHLKQ